MEVLGSSRSLLSLESLNGDETFSFLNALSTTPVWEAGGGVYPALMAQVQSWRLPRGSMPLVISHLYRQMFEETRTPPDVLSRIMAAIGDVEESYQSGHIFAVLRLLRHHRQFNRSLGSLCTEYISKPTREDKTPTTSQTTPAIGGPPVKRRRLSGSATQAASYIASPTEGELASLDLAINLQSGDQEDYSNPFTWSRLPFPFLYHSLPTHRFTLSKNSRHNVFDWMGRESFPGLVDVVSKFRKDSISPSAAVLHGTIGVGKSHLLAALAVWLRRQGKIVAYLPDCEDLAISPIRYMVAALLCAFSKQDAASRGKREEIRRLVTDGDILRWCGIQYEEGTHIHFVVDQFNAIDDQGGSTRLSSALKERARDLLLSSYCAHFSFRSSSANDKPLLGLQQRETVIVSRQQLTKTELASWTAHFSDRIPTFTTAELTLFNDYVGGVFLFYTALLDHSGASFSDSWQKIIYEPVLRNTRLDVQQFAIKALISGNERLRTNYLEGARAFLTGGSTKALSRDLIDHHHCYMADDGERGCLTSGIVRAELYAILEREDPSIALSTDWLDEGFRNVIESPSVLGFMVKQSTLTYFLGGVTGPGLVNWPKVKKHTLRHWQSLPRDLPSVLKGPDTTAILVTPEAFNFEATDGLFIKVNGPQKEVTLVSIRVALAQSHKDYDSDLAFYSRWPAWEKYFAGYTLKTAFLWVVDDEPLRLNFLKEAQSREGTREWPAHEEHFIALKTIAPRVGESLEWAREREQSRISSQTTV